MVRMLVPAVILFCVAVPLASGADAPSVTARVEAVGASMVYEYTLTNDIDPSVDIHTFALYMPEAGARQVLDFSCSKAGWYSTRSFRGDYSIWVMSALAGAAILQAETAVFVLTTPVGVSTGWDFAPPDYPSNWQWAATTVEFGPASLPVPIPEPCSLLALAAGLTRLILRRRR